MIKMVFICSILRWNHLPWAVSADCVSGNACMGRLKVIWVAGRLQGVGHRLAICIHRLWATWVPLGTSERNYRTVFRTSYSSIIPAPMMMLLGPPRAPGCLGEEWLVKGSCRSEGEIVAMLWTSTNWWMVELRKMQAGLGFPWFLRRMISAVGGLAAAGTPSHESQEAFSEERSKNCARAALAHFFSVPSKRPFCCHVVPAPLSSLSHTAYPPPFPHPPHCCGGWESGGKLSAQDRYS